jgi:hypothetical protein
LSQAVVAAHLADKSDHWEVGQGCLDRGSCGVCMGQRGGRGWTSVSTVGEFLAAVDRNCVPREVSEPFFGAT